MLEHDPERLSAIFCKAELLKEHKQLEKALEYYDRAIEKGFKDAYLAKAAVLMDLDMHEEAFSLLVSCPDQEDHLLQYNLGNCYKQLRQYDQALLSYNRCLQKKPDFH